MKSQVSARVGLNQRLWRGLVRAIEKLLFGAAASVLAFGIAACDHPQNHGSRKIGHGDITFDVCPSRDSIVFSAGGAGGRDLYLMQMSDLSVAVVAQTPEYELWPSFSSDGAFLVYAARISGDNANHIFIRCLADGVTRQLTRADANDASPRFSPDGSTVVFARDKDRSSGGLAADWTDGGVICVVLVDGAEEKQLTRDEIYAYEPRFTSDGSGVVFNTSQGRMILDLGTSGEPQSVPGPRGAVTSPNGELLAYARGQFSPDYRVYLAKPDGTMERVLTPSVAGCFRPTFASAGDQVLFLREQWADGPTGLPRFSLWGVPVAGGEPQRIADHRLFDDPLAWASARDK